MRQHVTALESTKHPDHHAMSYTSPEIGHLACLQYDFVRHAAVTVHYCNAGNGIKVAGQNSEPSPAASVGASPSCRTGRTVPIENR